MKPSMSGSGTKNKKAYYLSDELQFTLPFIKTLGKLSENSSPPLPEDEEESGLLEDESLLETHLSSPSPTTSSSMTYSLLEHQYHQAEPIREHNIPKKKKCSATNDLNYASSSGNQVDTEPREEALKMFLLSFVPELMKMDDREVRQFKKKTLDAVDEIMSARSRFPSSSDPKQKPGLEEDDV